MTARSRNRNGYGPGVHNPYMRTILNPPPQPLMPGSYPAQQQRRPLLQQPALQPMIMQPTIGNQRPMQIQYPQSLYRLPTQQPPALSHHHLQFPPHQAIYGATPPYAPPVTTQTIRQPTPNRNSRGYNTKKTTKAIAIIDPDTNEALDTSFIKSNTSEVQSSVVSSSQSSEAKKKEFIDEVHKIANTKPPSTADTSQHRPNAIISDIQLKNTETVSKISVIDSSAKSNEMKHVVEITSDVSNQSGFLTKVTEVQPSIQIGSLSSNCTGTQDMELEGRYEQLQLETLSVQPEIKQQTHMESKVQPDDEHVILLPSQDGCSLKPDNNTDHQSSELGSSSCIETTDSDIHEVCSGDLDFTTREIVQEPQVQPLPMKSDSTEISLESEETVSDDVIPDVEVTDDSKGSNDDLEETVVSEKVHEDMDIVHENKVVNGHDKDIEEVGFLKDAHGRYIYKRDFLLRYQSQSIPPPSSLEETDIFCPGGNTMSYKRDYRGGPNSSKANARKIIEHNPSKVEKVELRKADVRWMRPAERHGIATDEERKETDEVFRKFQGILNKLTPQKFKDLAERARDLNIGTEERLKGCIDKIFSKALEEPNFSVAYAHLCRVMSFIKVEVITKNDNGEETIKETTFRRELLTRCQREFEKDKKDDESREEQLKAIENATTDEERKQREEELKEWEDRSRKRSLGNIRFIGELFKLKMLSESIMHECIVRLLRSTSDEDALECFSRLITTTGKELDHAQAKQRLDRYFERINEIIEKKKISSRIRFMLQDVQELRKNDWVPRRQDTLKTIDQIHHEAEMEAIQEKEMIRSMQPSGKQYQRDDKKRGKEEYSAGRKCDKPGGRRDSTPDVSRIQALSSRKEKSTPTVGLRPGGWKTRNTAATPPPASNDAKIDKEKLMQKGPQRSSSSVKRQLASSGVRVGQPNVRRSSTNPDSEKTETLKAVKDFLGKKPCDKMTEDVVERKTITIVNELIQNGDFKEAMECVIELESPGLLHVFVLNAINHSLEKSSQAREFVGKLLDLLIKQKQIPFDKFLQGVQNVLEFAEDLEVDIPKVWDFLSEIIAPLICGGTLQLSVYAKVLKDAKLGRKSAKSVAKVLKQCKVLSNETVVIEYWKTSELEWIDLGLCADEVDDFIQQEKLSFLISQEVPISLPDEPPYLKDLSVMFGSQNYTNDDILDWIERTIKREELKSVLCIRTLARAAVNGSTSGGFGNSCIFNDENFKKRLLLLKKCVDEDEYLQEVVLDGIQVGVTLLKHPPGIMSKMFFSLYDVDVITEAVFIKWKEMGTEMFGRGVALQSVKNFFHFLDTAETESDTESGQ